MGRTRLYIIAQAKTSSSRVQAVATSDGGTVLRTVSVSHDGTVQVEVSEDGTVSVMDQQLGFSCRRALLCRLY